LVKSLLSLGRPRPTRILAAAHAGCEEFAVVGLSCNRRLCKAQESPIGRSPSRALLYFIGAIYVKRLTSMVARQPSFHVNELSAARRDDPDPVAFLSHRLKTALYAMT
jgi:hypothetical protein